MRFRALGETGIVGFLLFAGAAVAAAAAVRPRIREDGATTALAISRWRTCCTS